jgi:hypothetical protein
MTSDLDQIIQLVILVQSVEIIDNIYYITLYSKTNTPGIIAKCTFTYATDTSLDTASHRRRRTIPPRSCFDWPGDRHAPARIAGPYPKS